jgi:uncharacterized membrane protein
MGDAFMTEAELWNSHFLGMANVIDALGGIVTVTSGYLAIAYLVGNRLNRYQALLISALYVVVALNSLAVVLIEMRATRHFAELLMQNFATTIFPPKNLLTLIGMGVFTLMIPACLYFMYEVRKNPRVSAHTD